MTDDGSPVRPPAKPPRTFVYDHAGEEVEGEEVKGSTAEHLEPLIEECVSDKVDMEDSTVTQIEESAFTRVKETGEICDTNATVLKLDQDPHKEPETVELSSESEKHADDGSGGKISQESIQPARTIPLFTGRESAPPRLQEDFGDDVNVNSREPSHKMQPKNIPELLSLESNLEQLEVMTRTRVTPVLEEPDIIQITKSSSLPRTTPAQPVAPPRRKKKNRAPLPPNQVSTIFLYMYNGPPLMLPVINSSANQTW